MNAAQGTSPTTVSAVVLLTQAPAGVAELVGLLMPGAEAQMPAGVQELTVDINEVPVRFEIVADKLTAPEFEYAVSQSLLRERVQAASDTHGAFLVLTADVGADVFKASFTLSNLAARFAADNNGLAVWSPDSDLATTDVVYAGEVDQRPALVWFNAMAARIDAETSLAHTIGLGYLGGTEVQVRSTTLSPADAYGELRGAVATLLESGALPAAGGIVQLGGVAHTLAPSPSVIGMGDVLEARPVSAAGAPAVSGAPAIIPSDAVDAAPAKRKNWFGRRARD